MQLSQKSPSLAGLSGPHASRRFADLNLDLKFREGYVLRRYAQGGRRVSWVFRR